MILTIDIGNTNTGIAVLDVFSGVETRQCPVSKIIRIETVKTGLRECYEKRLTKALKMVTGTFLCEDKMRPSAIFICSVVPKATVIAARCVKKIFKITPEIIGKDIIVPIRNLYDDPKQVGQDRLVCAYAAAELYGTPAVVVDLGTAITFDVISAEKEYLGGLIAPGILLSAEALFARTALLPKVVIQKPRQIIGKSTEESILSGMFYGYGEMIKGVMDLLVKELGKKPKVVITGGFSDAMTRYVPQYSCIVDKELIFKGMALLHETGLWMTGRRS